MTRNKARAPGFCLAVAGVLVSPSPSRARARECLVPKPSPCDVPYRARPAQADRDLIKQLRLLYRDSLRRERTFYWIARLQPARYPLLYMTYIADGATQTMYLCPRFIGLDHGRDCLQVKVAL